LSESQQYDGLSNDQLSAIDTVCVKFERALRSSSPVTMESQLNVVPPQLRKPLFCELLAMELEWRQEHDQNLDVADYQTRFPTYIDQIRQAFSAAMTLPDESSGQPGFISQEIRTTPENGSIPGPQSAGRYQLEQIVGQGTFGVVYRARDEQLDRMVAIKLPHRSLVSTPEQVRAYLSEAQIVAGLDHPHIVPVYDFGSTNEFPCYIVSKFINGGSLSTQLKEKALNHLVAAELIATIAARCRWLTARDWCTAMLSPAIF
jgi:hypothetical protein